MSDNSFVLTPGEAQRALDVSASGLRRLAIAYEDIHGPLGKDRHGARVWTGQSVERLRAARSLLEAGRCRSVKDGLILVRDGVERAAPGLNLRARDDEPRAMVAEALEALRLEVAELRREVVKGWALPEAQSESGARGVTGGVTRTEGGVLVRLAHRLERLLGRRGVG